MSVEETRLASIMIIDHPYVYRDRHTCGVTWNPRMSMRKKEGCASVVTIPLIMGGNSNYELASEI